MNGQGRYSSRQQEQEMGLSMAQAAFCGGQTFLSTSSHLTCCTPSLQSPRFTPEGTSTSYTKRKKKIKKIPPLPVRESSGSF